MKKLKHIIVLYVYLSTMCVHRMQAAEPSTTVSVTGAGTTRLLCSVKYPEVNYSRGSFDEFVSDLSDFLMNIEWTGKPPVLEVSPDVARSSSRLTYAGKDVPVLVFIAEAAEQFAVDIRITRERISIVKAGVK